MGDGDPVLTTGHGISSWDLAARDVLRLRTPFARNVAEQTSNVLVGTLALQPLAQDLIEKGAVLHDWRGAAGSSVIDGIAQGLSFGVNEGAKYGFAAADLGRRPNYAACLANPSYGAYCGDTHGMWSGHSQAAWTPVGIAIAHRLFDSETPTPIWEIVALSAAATATSYARVAADDHTITHVTLGAAAGVGIGLGVPALANALGLGYNHWNRQQASGVAFAPTLSAGPDGAQVGITGVF
jgi:hypothetical protein